MQGLRIVRTSRDGREDELSLGRASAWIANYLTGVFEGPDWQEARNEVKDALARGREFRTALATYRRMDRGIPLEGNRPMAGSSNCEAGAFAVQCVAVGHQADH